ncbi:MAG TPA: NAD(P)/FAD-dependent oxidoreductase [Deltaproteobacteria bacterium]|nr:NAD(P)/FAD-dependent oxidoreductase [Deltaproteobacteria bacterium]
MSGKRILVLGGGIGGVACATLLRQGLAPEHRVTLVDRSDAHIFAPAMPWLMLGLRRPAHMVRSLEDLKEPAIEFVRACVEAVDTERRKVVTSTGTLDYDYLVVALGVELAPEKLPGLSEGAFNVYEMDGAAAMGAELREIDSGRVVVLVSSLPFKCPAAPYEYALLIDDYLRKRGVRPRIELEIVTPEKLPMAVAGPALGAEVVRLLRERDIRFTNEAAAEAVDAGAARIRLGGGEEVPYDLLAAVPPHAAPRALSNSALAGPDGWAPVDAATLASESADVFVIGDAAAVRLKNGMMLPKAGVFAHAQAKVVAWNIIKAVKGVPPDSRFTGTGYCFLEAGGSRAAFAKGDFYAEPDPQVRLYRPSIVWHLGKLLFEKWWLLTFFSEKKRK